MGYKKLSDEQELQLIEEYKEGAPVHVLMERYGFKTKKSITDKIKKHYPDTYKEIIEEARIKRKGYNYKLEKIVNEFDAYFLGLLLTDGYISGTGDRYQVGIDLTDEECIAFLSHSINKAYKTYEQTPTAFIDGREVMCRKFRHRLLLEDKDLYNNLQRLGVVPNKTMILKGPNLLPEEEQFIPYIIRGIIDGDGTVSPTSYGAPQFRIVTASEDFAKWLVDILTNKLYMKDIKYSFVENNGKGLFQVGSANQDNIQKLISLSYNKPFGMMRKYEQIRETFRDYNNGAYFI